MQSGENYRGWRQSMASLKEKWNDLTHGIVRVVAEEEMRICREELNSHIGTYGQTHDSLETAQERRGEDG